MSDRATQHVDVDRDIEDTTRINVKVVLKMEESSIFSTTFTLILVVSGKTHIF